MVFSSDAGSIPAISTGTALLQEPARALCVSSNSNTNLAIDGNTLSAQA